MQIAFFTAIMGDQPVEEVAHWAAGAGFASLELDMANHGGDAAASRKAVAAVRSQGLEVCTLTCFGNLLDADRAARERVRAVVRTAVDVAAETGVGLVCTFPGRDEGASEDDNYRQLAEYYRPLVEHAARGNVKVIMENWPGPRVNYLATTPAGWARLFDLVPAPNLGLNFDPSHLVWQGIDHEPALRAVAGRVFLAHAKDTEIFPDRLQQTGYFGKGWWAYRLPGRGRIDWGRWLSLLREVGFDGVVSIEHEDGDYGAMRGPLQRRQEGLLEAQRVLRENMR
ncbi:MAG TPA: sugar phosphate isomerase/epimerase [Chloroflexota bacterium]|nr:sugar phosphate isomerase/epimerase [Chloroflexota bacterium]